MRQVPNLCVMGGDAHAIVRSHLKPSSVSHAFINFPEPPSGYLGVESASNELHLLTPAFFTALHHVLRRDGRLTILSDNGRYCRSLCATLGQLREHGSPGREPREGARLFACEDLRGASGEGEGEGAGPPSYELVSGVRLYHGTPGSECGHTVSASSYFDRLWEYRQGEATERFFLALRRAT